MALLSRGFGCGVSPLAGRSFSRGFLSSCLPLACTGNNGIIRMVLLLPAVTPDRWSSPARFPERDSPVCWSWLRVGLVLLLGSAQPDQSNHTKSN